MAYQVTGGGRPAALYASADVASRDAIRRMTPESVSVEVRAGEVWTENLTRGRWVRAVSVAKLLNILGQEAGMNGVRITTTVPVRTMARVPSLTEAPQAAALAD